MSMNSPGSRRPAPDGRTRPAPSAQGVSRERTARTSSSPRTPSAYGAPQRPRTQTARPSERNASAGRSAHSAAYAVRTPSARSASARPASARPAPARTGYQATGTGSIPRRYSSQEMNSRRPAPKAKSGEGVFRKILMGLAAVVMIFAACFGFLGKWIRKFNRLFDRFRTSPASAMVVNSLMGMTALILVIAILIAFWPGIRMGWGNMMANFGNYDKAASIALTAEKSGDSAGKIASLRLKAASGMIEEKRYDEALSLLSLVGEADPKAAALSEDARMRKAESFYQSGRYEEASRLFYVLSSTEKGAARYNDCLCAMAIQAYMSGNDSEAHQLLISAHDAAASIGRVALDVTGSQTETNKLLKSDIFNTESLASLERAVQAVKDAQKNNPAGRIAVGNKHTVGLKKDGTVVAAGDNYYNQSNVSSWTGIKAVAAGAWHTVGLRTDGTVVATGNNSLGQLNTSEWTDIVMIACSDFDTIGLKSDGTIVSTGMHTYTDAAGWNGVTAIDGGGYSIACLYGQGMMMSSHTGAQMKASMLFADLSVSGAYSAGVLFDGTLASSFENAPEWSNLVRVEASSTGLFGVTSSGSVLTHFFRASDDPGIQVASGAIDVVSSGTHHVVLFENGTVRAFGLNDAGQANVSGWQL